MSAPVRPEAELDRLREFASIGASWAATALAQLTGLTVITPGPVLYEAGRIARSASRGPDPEHALPDELSTGVLFDVEGDVEGVVAILLPEAARDRIVEKLLGGLSDPDPDAVGSALRELGNILASQMVSAIANTLGARCLLSVPALALEGAERALETRLAERRGGPGLIADSLLLERGGDLRALVVFAPDATKDEPPPVD